jgi:hypothetical protein
MSKKVSSKAVATGAAAAARRNSEYVATFGGTKRPTRDQIFKALDRIFKESGCTVCGLGGKISLLLGDPFENVDIPNVNIIQQKFGG